MEPVQPNVGGNQMGPEPGEQWAGAAPSEQWAGAAPSGRRWSWPAMAVASVASLALGVGGTLGVILLNDPPESEANSAVDATTQSDGGTTGGGLAPGGNTQGGKSLDDLEGGTAAAVAAAVRGSVVAINVSTRMGGAEGSGVILDTAGNILTNDHVVGDAQSISVSFGDGRVFAAHIVGTDPETDLAVIALDSPPADLEPATLGSSGELQVGQAVLAVGNPLGLSSTVTSGIISALNRPVSTRGADGGAGVVTNAIQVDAAINPGNSGGPLFDMDGRVIGITSSIATVARDGQQAGSIGLGFAIPVDLAGRVAGEIIANGSAAHAYLGVALLDGEAQVDGVTRQGAQIAELVPGTAAAGAGLRVGDVVVTLDGDPVTGAESLTGFVRAFAPGSAVTLGVVRDGSQTEVPVVLGEA